MFHVKHYGVINMAKNKQEKPKKLIDVLYDYYCNGGKRENKYFDEYKNIMFNSIMFNNFFHGNNGNKNKKNKNNG